jgi:hypothetical protein
VHQPELDGTEMDKTTAIVEFIACFVIFVIL